MNLIFSANRDSSAFDNTGAYFVQILHQRSDWIQGVCPMDLGHFCTLLAHYLGGSLRDSHITHKGEENALCCKYKVTTI